MDSPTFDATTRHTISRPLCGDEDFWRVQNLLIETYPITALGFNWDIRRWEGKRFYDAIPAWDPDFPPRVRLWEIEEGQLVGVVNPEGTGDAYLQLHPEYRHLEDEMMAWAEEHLAAPTEDVSRRQLYIEAYEYDELRQQVLEQRCYEKTEHYGFTRRLRFTDQPVARPTIVEGYTLRATRADDSSDDQRIADLLNAAFNRDFHNAIEYHNFTKFAPSFRRELDLVAIAPDGSFAAYVGIPYDETNRRGIFEPVCTHPDHRRRGLGKALMLEGLHRLKVRGALDATVGTGSMIPANRLYDSIGFTEKVRAYVWRKVF